MCEQFRTYDGYLHVSSTKRHVKLRLSFIFRLRAIYPTWGWRYRWRRLGCSLRSLRPGMSLRGKTHGSQPVSTMYWCLEMQSMRKRRPELVVQTLATINVRWRSFPAGGSPTDRGVSYTGGSTVGRIFGPGPRNSNGTSGFRGMPNGSRRCCGCGSWSASVCGTLMSAVIQPGA